MRDDDVAGLQVHAVDRVHGLAVLVRVDDHLDAGREHESEPGTLEREAAGSQRGALFQRFVESPWVPVEREEDDLLGRCIVGL